VGDGRAGRPFVYADERSVSLHFDLAAVQSRMRRADPAALELAYTRAMMGWLLWRPEAASLLMVGLGGGSLPKYCHRHLPAADITVVEIDADVIALRGAFQVPPDGERFRVLHDDGAAFVACAAHDAACYDVVLVDGFSADGQPQQLCSARFYADCRALLAPGGVLVVNLHNEKRCDRWQRRIERAFDGEVLAMTTPDRGNRVVFAGVAPLQDFEARWLALPEVHRRTLAKCVGRLKGCQPRRTAAPKPGLAPSGPRGGGHGTPWPGANIRQRTRSPG